MSNIFQRIWNFFVSHPNDGHHSTREYDYARDGVTPVIETTHVDEDKVDEQGASYESPVSDETVSLPGFDDDSLNEIRNSYEVSHFDELADSAVKYVEED